MSTFVLIHGAGDVGWYWHLVEAHLRKHGHDVVAPDLPCNDDFAGLAASCLRRKQGVIRRIDDVPQERMGLALA